MIPDEAIVSTQEFLFPQLFKKKGSMVYPRLESKDNRYKADYVFLDRTNNGLKRSSPAYIPDEKLDMMIEHPNVWQKIIASDGYVLYRRIGERE